MISQPHELSATMARRAALGLSYIAALSCAPGEPIEDNLSPAPGVVSVSLSPDSTEIARDATVAFEMTIELSDGSTIEAPFVDYHATGGTIESDGNYRAGQQPGLFRVIGQTGDYADTSVVVILGNPEPNLIRISLDPGSAALLPGASQNFSTNGIFSDSSVIPLTVDYSATGGSISSSGRYTAGQTSGLFQVIASLKGILADTAVVEIGQPPPNLAGVEVSPPTANVLYGQTVQFTAAGRLSDGTTSSLPVTWTATGGVVTANGTYTAGAVAGAYRIIARASNGMADTSAITISAPVIASLDLKPDVVNLQFGQIQQFTVTATLTNGTTQNNPSVTYAFSGGLMTQSGLYTAGLVPGTYRVIARATNGVADTSQVNITADILAAINVTPLNATVQTGASLQFDATGILSNGGTQPDPDVVWSTTGGTVSNTGLFTAGTTPGTFQVRAQNLLALLGATATVTVVAAPPPNMFFNSAEPGCGSDPNVLMCDDFEDGDWYTIDYDRAIATGGLLQTDGWGGTIYANPITPAGAAVCGNQGVRSDCAATHGQLSGSQGGRNMAEHELSQRVEEMYVRYYTKALSGYRFGAEKVLTFNIQNGGGIRWGNLHFNCGGGGGQTVGQLQFQPTFPETRNCQNVMQIQSDRWYYIEVRLRLNTVGQSNGIVQVWADDCGPNGTACPSTPTQRLQITNWRFNRNSSNELIGSLWWENWANPGSSGTRLIDQIKVSRVGPIGPMP